MRTIALVACVRSKCAKPAAAAQLYNSPWFRKAWAYAEQNADPWYILSAKYGVVSPDDILEPYDESLIGAAASERRTWAATASETPREIIAPEDKVIVLAGLRYREHLENPLHRLASRVSVPMQGLGIRRTASISERTHRIRPMSFGDLSSSKAVEAAMAECDAIGRAAFLEKYGYGRAREYFLVHEGRYYDSKAIAGVAHQYQFPGDGPLAHTEFSGGRATVMQRLESLGFQVVAREEDALDAIVDGPENAEAGITVSTQGNGLTGAERKVVEQRAVELARDHFGPEWTVEDVGGTESYDLRCERHDEELHVEVKGTTGKGEYFMLTANEVEHAQTWYPHVALVVVSRIELDRDDRPKASGGQRSVYHPWDLGACEVRPTQFECTRPDRG
jgi:hypothetical protein